MPSGRGPPNASGGKRARRRRLRPRALLKAAELKGSRGAQATTLSPIEPIVSEDPRTLIARLKALHREEIWRNASNGWLARVF